MENRPWSLQHARDRFGALVEDARRGKPQFVTKCGVPAVVVLAAEEYARLKALDERQAPSLVDHLLAIPQDDESFDRLELEPRDVRSWP